MVDQPLFSAASTISDLNRKLKEAKSGGLRESAGTGVSVTVLANFSTQYLVQALDVCLLNHGIRAEIHESSFDQWELELVNERSETRRRRPDYTLLLLSSTRLILNPIARDPAAFAGYLKGLLLRYQAASGGKILLSLPESLREGIDQTSPFHGWVQEIRASLLRELADVVSFFDVDPLIREFGFDRWHSPRFLISAKLSCHPNCYPAFGSGIADALRNLIRRPVKLVITDLDHTLWGGVVGDVGWENVDLDAEKSGYAHLMLQRYLLGLREAGVLLAVCSKNTAEVTRKVFENRSEMILKLEDCVAYEVNWEPKSRNIERILKTLNLTTSGVVFLDDSKLEREEIRGYFPEIVVPELPENPESWCEFLAKSGCLGLGSIREEDRSRSESYHAERQRTEAAAKFSDYSEFLKSLGLTLTPERISAGNLDRVYDLIQKTNQFNLTTKRLSLRELEEAATAAGSFSYCYRLKDRYSDYGIISVLMAARQPDSWAIGNWLMSCRAMGRGVENAVFGHFVSSLSEGDTIEGEYIETEKNQAIAGLLGTMGFSRLDSSPRHVFRVGRDRFPGAAHIRHDAEPRSG